MGWVEIADSSQLLKKGEKNDRRWAEGRAFVDSSLNMNQD